tara:strand:- start:5073 stop:5336 length:264 start_codon:yes stop_codon:yes gene_type:complete
MKTKTVRDVDVREIREVGDFDYNLDAYDLHLIKIHLEKIVDEQVKNHNEYCMERYNKLRKVPYNTGLGRLQTTLDKVTQTISLLETI